MFFDHLPGCWPFEAWEQVVPYLGGMDKIGFLIEKGDHKDLYKVCRDEVCLTSRELEALSCNGLAMLGDEDNLDRLFDAQLRWKQLHGPPLLNKMLPYYFDIELESSMLN